MGHKRLETQADVRKALDRMTKTRSAKVRETLASQLREAETRATVPCCGEAHSNPHIDNCMQCAPFWGWRLPQ